MENEISVERISHATLCSNTQAANSCYQLKDQVLGFATETVIVKWSLTVFISSIV